MVVRKPSRGHVDDAALQARPWARRRSSGRRNRACPIPWRSLEDRLHLAGRVDVERHEDRRLQLAGERLDVFLRLVVEIGHGELGPERAKRLGAAPRDRLLVGNPDDETRLAFEQLGLHGGNHGGTPFALGFDELPFEVAIGDLLQLAEGLTSVLGITHMGDLPAVDLQASLTPGRDIDLKVSSPTDDVNA